MLRQDGSTPLHYASSRGHAELCTLLLRAKADVEAKDEVPRMAHHGAGKGGTNRKIELIKRATHRSRGRGVWPLIFSFGLLLIVSLWALLLRTCSRLCSTERMAALVAKRRLLQS